MSKELLFGTAGIPLSSRSRTTEAGIERVRELGLDCMEVEFVRGITMTPEGARFAGAVAADRGVRLSAHAPYFINLNAREPLKVIASQQRILKTAQITSILGGTSVVFHAGFYMDGSPADAFAAVKRRLSDVVADLQPNGGNLCIRPEVMGKHRSFGTLDEILRLSTEIEAVAPAIDFAHLHARTGAVNSYSEFTAILGEIESALGRAALGDVLIHVSGIEYGPKGETRHTTLGESDFRYVELMRALKDRRVAGVVICESPNREEDALLLQETYRAL